MNGKKILLIITIFFSLSAALWGETGKNLLTNGGFENAIEGTGWHVKAWEKEFKLTRSTEKKFRGRYSIKIETGEKQNDVRLIQNVKVQPNSYYKLSGWIATENVGQNGVGGNLSIYGTLHNVGDIKGTNNWKYVELYLQTNSTQKMLSVGGGIGIFFSDAKGTVYIDELSFVKVNERPANFVTLANPGDKNKKSPRNETKKMESSKELKEAEKKRLHFFLFCLFGFLICGASAGILLYKHKTEKERLTPLKDLILFIKGKWFPLENPVTTERAPLGTKGKTFVNKKKLMKKILINELRSYFRKKR